jgi:hypothetical protein
MAKIGMMAVKGPGVSTPAPLPGIPHVTKAASMPTAPKPRQNLTMIRISPPKRLSGQAPKIKPPKLAPGF